jgi:hypothetical protein
MISLNELPGLQKFMRSNQIMDNIECKIMISAMKIAVCLLAITCTLWARVEQARSIVHSAPLPTITSPTPTVLHLPTTLAPRMHAPAIRSDDGHPASPTEPASSADPAGNLAPSPNVYDLGEGAHDGARAAHAALPRMAGGTSSASPSSSSSTPSTHSGPDGWASPELLRNSHEGVLGDAAPRVRPDRMAPSGAVLPARGSILPAVPDLTRLPAPASASTAHTVQRDWASTSLPGTPGSARSATLGAAHASANLTRTHEVAYTALDQTGSEAGASRGMRLAIMSPFVRGAPREVDEHLAAFDQAASSLLDVSPPPTTWAAGTSHTDCRDELNRVVHAAARLRTVKVRYAQNVMVP